MSSASARVVAPSRSWFASGLGARATQLVGNELADDVLQYLDPVERGRALAVNQRWRVVGARLEALDEAALWAQSDMAEIHKKFEMQKEVDKNVLSFILNRFYSNHVHDAESPYLLDPLAESLVRRFENGLSGRVEDGVGTDGTSSAASFVNLFLFLRTKNVVGNVLIIAPEAEMPKWMTAFYELPVEMPVTRCFKSDLTQMLSDDQWLQLGDGDIHVHLCAYEEAAKYWSLMNEVFEDCTWQYFIVDEGDGQHGEDWPWRRRRHDGTYGFDDVQCEHRFVLYRPRHRLTFDDAIFHCCFACYFSYTGQTFAEPLAGADKFTHEKFRRFVSPYLDESIMSAAPGYRIGRAHEHLLTQAAATHA